MLSLAMMVGWLASLRTLMSVSGLGSRTMPGNFRPLKGMFQGSGIKASGFAMTWPWSSQTQFPECSVDDAHHWGPDAMGEVTSACNGKRNKGSGKSGQQ